MRDGHVIEKKHHPTGVRFSLRALLIWMILLGLFGAAGKSGSLHYGSMSRSWGIESWGFPCPAIARDVFFSDENSFAPVNERSIATKGGIRLSYAGCITDLVTITILTALICRTIDRVRRFRKP